MKGWGNPGFRLGIDGVPVLSIQFAEGLGHVTAPVSSG